ncbi:MAG: ATP-grasp domain-containing protein [Patescibacteria group bacterium]
MKILEIGFTGVPFFNKNVKKEAESRGHSVDFCSANSLNVDIGSDTIDIRADEFDLQEYDVIHVGSLVQNRWPVIAALGYLKENGCVIVDDRLVSSMLDQYSGLAKYFTEEENGINLPRSIVFKKVSQIEDKIKEFKFPAIIKNNCSKQGLGVGLAKNIDDIKEFVNNGLKADPKMGFILREYIPNNGDYRVNVIDGVAVVCLKRTPKKGEYRSNISRGGTLTNANPDDVVEVCAVAEKIVQLANYDIAGVDVMVHKETGVPYVLEINRAPGSLEDDVEVSGVDIAGLIVDLYEKRHANNRYLKITEKVIS